MPSRRWGCFVFWQSWRFRSEGGGCWPSGERGRCGAELKRRKVQDCVSAPGARAKSRCVSRRSLSRGSESRRVLATGWGNLKTSSPPSARSGGARVVSRPAGEFPKEKRSCAVETVVEESSPGGLGWGSASRRCFEAGGNRGLKWSLSGATGLCSACCDVYRIPNGISLDGNH